MPRLLPAVSALVVCGLASAQSTAPPRVVAADKLASYWSLDASSVQADAPLYGKNMEQPGCATVSFVVEPDGSTSTVKLQKVAPEGDLGTIAVSAAKSLRFAPTAFNAGHERVFSWLIFPFNLPSDPAARSAIMQRCSIDKLGWKDH
ncbi:MAG TPA: hypothetical protein VGC30_03270 [Dokdonella sp.]